MADMTKSRPPVVRLRVDAHLKVLEKAGAEGIPYLDALNAIVCAAPEPPPPAPPKPLTMRQILDRAREEARQKREKEALSSQNRP
jgi:hypothetical protein